MDADIEELVLSGKLFNGTSRSSSPRRSPSPDAGWHDDEMPGNDSDAERNAQIERMLGASERGPSVGMGTGRTGVKGVIRDRDEASEASRAKRGREIQELNSRMEKASLGGKTFLEEEAERQLEKAIREGRGSSTRVNVFGDEKETRFGHLREIGVDGFLAAVEHEERRVWIVIHIYHPSLDRCFVLDDKLAHLARKYPEVKFLHSRAAALGFASNPSSSSGPRLQRRKVRSSMPGRYENDEEDPYAYDGDDDDIWDEKDGGDYGDYEDEAEDDKVDKDMLPTVLVYRDGQLVYNWVRVDWEAGKAGIEDLLAKHHVLPTSSGKGNLGIPWDDEDDEDLDWSDGDEKL